MQKKGFLFDFYSLHFFFFLDDKNPCETNNGGCIQKCVHAYGGKHYCDCFEGYKKHGDVCEGEYFVFVVKVEKNPL